ncbi:Transcriptional adapter 2 [Mycena venus]|uniref:Transcriptional adapter 2 n=1 Tax=Mycena venus TaxID=2733690 RepID=A0A8H6XBY6_9AGAR|nr:Transcriptional adapter 2 [Mycena venus]
MTVTHRKPPLQPDEIACKFHLSIFTTTPHGTSPVLAVNEPGVQFECDSCACDLTHTIRIKCADPACQSEDGVDICPPCFCAGKEFGNHLRSHSYRVIEFNSYPIFSPDWGADEELLLIKGIASHGLGNWKKIAEHVGTQTKEEVEKHYNSAYVDSPNWPLPRMDLKFDIAPEEFQEAKRRRITEMNAMPISPPKAAPTSAPGIHEIATFLPGRLEFEHELDNEAEDLVKDLEFGVCLDFDGDKIPEDENDPDVKARIRWEEDKRNGIVPGTLVIPERKMSHKGKGPMPLVNGASNGAVNGARPNGDATHSKPSSQSEDVVMGNTNGTGTADEDEEVTQLPPIETQHSLAFKLTLLEMYAQRVEKRLESKGLMFDRGLLEYKKIQAAEKKRLKEEKDIIHRLRPFARLQTAEDYESFSTDILYEAMLRKKIQELQQYRRLGLSTAADIDKYMNDLAKRTQVKINPREYSLSDKKGRQSLDRSSQAPESHDRETTPKLADINAPSNARKRAPLNLANSPSLHLLTPVEQTLCSQLRILPKPYLVVKETLVREYARRGGKLRRREARDLVKIDVNKTSRVWDFLAQAGFLQINAEPFDIQPRPSAVECGPIVCDTERRIDVCTTDTCPSKWVCFIPSCSRVAPRSSCWIQWSTPTSANVLVTHVASLRASLLYFDNCT